MSENKSHNPRNQKGDFCKFHIDDLDALTDCKCSNCGVRLSKSGMLCDACKEVITPIKISRRYKLRAVLKKRGLA